MESKYLTIQVPLVVQVEKETLEEASKNLLASLKRQMSSSEPDAWVDGKEAQRLLGIKKSKLANLRATNQIIYSQVSPKNLMYSRESIELLLQENVR